MQAQLALNLSAAESSSRPEAYNACEGKSASDSCSVSLGDHTSNGACAADEQSKLFCKPDRMPPPPADGTPNR